MTVFYIFCPGVMLDVNFNYFIRVDPRPYYSLMIKGRIGFVCDTVEKVRDRHFCAVNRNYIIHQII